MSKYIDADKLIAEIEKLLAKAKNDEEKAFTKKDAAGHLAAVTKTAVCVKIKKLIATLQQEQPNNMIQWTGDNLKEVIDFTGKSPRFGEWFKSWEEYEKYVHSHNDILKLFCGNGNHYEVPVGAWIVKTPDGYNLPSVAKYIHQDQPEVDLDAEIAIYLNRNVLNRINNSDIIEDFTTMEAGELARHFWNKGFYARKEE